VWKSSSLLAVRGGKGKEQNEPVQGSLMYYVNWWEGKSVQEKSWTKILAETLAPLLLGTS
jgi:hypothetical protein